MKMTFIQLENTEKLRMMFSKTCVTCYQIYHLKKAKERRSLSFKIPLNPLFKGGKRKPLPFVKGFILKDSS